jgi:renalase
VLALPAPQAVALLAPLPQPFVALASAAASVVYDPCWAAMFTLSTPSNIEINSFGEVTIQAPETQLAKCIRQTTNSEAKGEHWVIHATTEWTKAHLSDTKEMAADALFTGFSKHYNYQQAPTNCAAHRWLYSQPAATTASHAAAVNDAAAHGLFCVGDWVQTDAITPTMYSVERAWVSGQRLAERF